MTRRIARGLFRLWIVASVVWLCAVGAVTTWWVLPKAAELSDAEVSKPPFDPSKPFEVVPDWAKPGGVPLQNLPDAPWVVTEQKKKAAIQTAAEIALIPPALVLALGAALGWVVKGFRD
jgi:hypothetical protein